MKSLRILGLIVALFVGAQAMAVSEYPGATTGMRAFEGPSVLSLLEAKRTQVKNFIRKNPKTSLLIAACVVAVSGLSAAVRPAIGKLYSDVRTYVCKWREVNKSLNEINTALDKDKANLEEIAKKLATIALSVPFGLNKKFTAVQDKLKKLQQEAEQLKQQEAEQLKQQEEKKKQDQREIYNALEGELTQRDMNHTKRDRKQEEEKARKLQEAEEKRKQQEEIDAQYEQGTKTYEAVRRKNSQCQANERRHVREAGKAKKSARKEKKTKKENKQSQQGVNTKKGNKKPKKRS